MIKRLMLCVVALSGFAFGQAVRYDSIGQGLAAGNVFVPIANGAISVYNYPGPTTNCATAGTCTLATTYIDDAKSSTCPTSTQLTRPTTNSCIGSLDSGGNFGFWALPGGYQYCISAAFFVTSCTNITLSPPPYSINNILFVDGQHYPLTATGIQAAITDATAGCRWVFISPTNGTPIAMGGTQIIIPSCVKVSGAGIGQTVLQWTSNLSSGAVGMTSTVRSYLGNLTLSFNSGNTSDAIRMIATDAAPAEFNTIENIYIDFSALGGSGLGGVGSSGIHASGSVGSLGTDIVLNSFHNIFMNAIDHAVVCNDCEGNHWQVTGQNLGASVGSTLFWETGFNADEIGDLRIESGTGNFANETCYSTTGNNNIIRLTCDGNLTGITAVNDIGQWNIFDVNTVGAPTLGTISTNSQYRYVSSSNGLNEIGVGILSVIHPLLYNTAPTIASGFGTSPSIVNSNGTSVFEINVGTGGSATSGVITMPAAQTGWGCTIQDMNTNIANRESAFTITSFTITAASAWTASDKLLVHCGAF